MTIQIDYSIFLECEEPKYENYPNMKINFDQDSCQSTYDKNKNKTMYNIDCRITFSCKDENHKKEYILSEGENAAKCAEDKDVNEANWNEPMWPSCDQGTFI